MKISSNLSVDELFISCGFDKKRLSKRESDLIKILLFMPKTETTEEKAPEVKKTEEAPAPVEAIHMNITDFLILKGKRERWEEKYYKGNFDDGLLHTEKEWMALTEM